MSKKPKFRPEVMRIKLNPEQAVLTCNCHGGWYQTVQANAHLNHNGVNEWICGTGAGTGRNHWGGALCYDHGNLGRCNQRGHQGATSS